MSAASTKFALDAARKALAHLRVVDANAWVNLVGEQIEIFEVLVSEGDDADDDVRAVKKSRSSRANPTSKPKDPRVEAAHKAYERTHWGLTGRGVASKTWAPNPAIPSAKLGELVSVTYRTRKGADPSLVDWEHDFVSPRPDLAFNPSGLLILGGNYTVTERGIVR